VTLTATPATGWAFSGWSGDLSGSANPATITIDANKIVTATFSTTCVPVADTDFLFTPRRQSWSASDVHRVGYRHNAHHLHLELWRWRKCDHDDDCDSTQLPVTNTVQTYTTMLTATNACGSQSPQKPITVRPYGIYLPVVTRNP